MNEYYKQILADDERPIDREIEIQKIASNYGFAPKIIDYKLTYNKEDKKYVGNITMEHLNEMCIADKYSDDPAKIPKVIWDQIRAILKILYHEEGIEYIDITPYNFIEKDEKVYIIDFGHASYYKSKEMMNWFVKQFLEDGTNEWNPDFK